MIFSQDIGIVNSDKLNVRTMPNIESEIVGQFNAGKIVQIYSSSGAGVWKEGIIDSWFAINKELSQWVNSFYVYSFPMKILERGGKDVIGTKYYKYYRISDVRNREGILEFNIGRSAVISNNGDGHVRQDYWLAAESILWKDNASPRIYEFTSQLNKHYKELFEGLLVEDKITEEQANYKITYKDEGIILIRGISMGDYVSELHITNSDYILPFGIHVGIDKETIIKILGEEQATKSNVFMYKTGYGEISRIEFKITKNIVEKISVYYEF